MREIRNLVTTQIRLFSPDLIPLIKLSHPEFGKKFQALFEFQAIEPFAPQGTISGIQFLGGLDKSSSTIIESVSIESRRIQVKVQGKSVVAKSVFETLSEQITSLNDGKSLSEIVCAHETGSSVVLDFFFEQLLSEKLNYFLKKSATKYMENRWSEALILPTNLKFSVRFKLNDDQLIKSNIALSPKELIIEPRLQSSPDEKLFWIASPTDTDTHFKLIEDLEHTLLG